MDMEGYFTIYLFFFGDITGYPRFLMCILVGSSHSLWRMEVFQFMGGTMGYP